MDKYIVKGKANIKGTVSVNGAKNAGLPILAATLLAEGEYEITNIPNLTDIRTMAKLLKNIGAEIEWGDGKIKIKTNGCENHEAPYDLVKTMRASIYVLGPLVARKGEARVSFPGGCALGARPIDLHLKGLRKLGADIELKHGYIYATANRLKGTGIYFEKKSVGATANILMASVLAEGETKIQNAACEPEIAALAEFLVRMGADIKGIGTETLIIKGKEKLHSADASLIPDRIETGTLLLSAAITRGSITVEDCNPDHLGIVLDKLEEAGFQISTTENSISLNSKGSKYPIEITTNPYPGFPTDLQPQFCSLLSTIEGDSSILETIFSDRFIYTTELQRLGANLKLNENELIIKGGAKLSGAPVMASDIRAGASLVVASLYAEGKTEISRIYHLDRGHDKLEEKLQKLGVDIKRIK